MDLIIGKVYPIIPDIRAQKDDFIRIIYESGEDYLYHQSHFVFVDIPSPVRKVLLEVMKASNKPLRTDERRVKVTTKRQHTPRAARG